MEEWASCHLTNASEDRPALKSSPRQQQWWKKKTNMDEFINCIAFFLLEKLEYKIKYKHFLLKKI